MVGMVAKRKKEISTDVGLSCGSTVSSLSLLRIFFLFFFFCCFFVTFHVFKLALAKRPKLPRVPRAALLYTVLEQQENRKDSSQNLGLAESEATNVKRLIESIN